MQIELSQIRKGSVVIVQSNFGAGPAKQVTVTAVDDDIKNGEPGFEYADHWAYLDQITKIVTF